MRMRLRTLSPQQQCRTDAAAVVGRYRCVLCRTGSAQGLQSLGQMALAHIAHGLHAPPQLLHGVAGGHPRLPVTTTAKSSRGAVRNAMVGIVEIVQHVDTATEQQMPIDDAHLAVQAAPALGQQQTQGAQR